VTELKYMFLVLQYGTKFRVGKQPHTHTVIRVFALMQQFKGKVRMTLSAAVVSRRKHSNTTCIILFSDYISDLKVFLFKYEINKVSP